MQGRGEARLEAGHGSGRLRDAAATQPVRWRLACCVAAGAQPAAAFTGHQREARVRERAQRLPGRQRPLHDDRGRGHADPDHEPQPGRAEPALVARTGPSSCSSGTRGCAPRSGSRTPTAGPGPADDQQRATTSTRPGRPTAPEDRLRQRPRRHQRRARHVRHERERPGQVNITNTPTIDEDYPAWSPDGSKIAFSRDGDIYTDEPGGRESRAADHGDDRTEIEPDWSPSGSQIAYHAGLSTDGRDLEDERQRDGADESHQQREPASTSARRGRPRATRSRSSRGAFNNAEVYMMNADGTVPTRITNNTVMDAHLHGSRCRCDRHHHRAARLAAGRPAGLQRTPAAGAGLTRRPSSRSTTTPTPRCPTSGCSRASPRASATRSPRTQCPRAGTRPSATCNDGSPPTPST